MSLCIFTFSNSYAVEGDYCILDGPKIMQNLCYYTAYLDYKVNNNIGFPNLVEYGHFSISGGTCSQPPLYPQQGYFLGNYLSAPLCKR